MPDEHLGSSIGWAAVLIAQELDNHDVAGELIFDVSHASEDVKFLGFVTGPELPRNELMGLFDWTCRGCTFHNRSSTTIESTQAFLARWVCTSCGKVTLVRFRCRANAEWVAQHTLTVAGATLSETTEPAVLSRSRAAQSRQRRQAGQKFFAFVAIPALALIIYLGLSDLHPVRSAWAYVSEKAGRPSGTTPSARLPGYWVSETGDHSLYFGRTDPVSKMGAYVLIPKSHEPYPWVRFTIVREQTNGVEMVIRELDERGNPTTPADTVLHLPKEGRALTRVSIAQGRPVLTVYRLIGQKRTRPAAARRAP